MKRAINLTFAVLTIFALLYLPACSAEPIIKADTESNFNSSFAEVIKGMSAEDKQTLVLRSSQMIQLVCVRAARAAVLSRSAVNHPFASEH